MNSKELGKAVIKIGMLKADIIILIILNLNPAIC